MNVQEKQPASIKMGFEIRSPFGIKNRISMAIKIRVSVDREWQEREQARVSRGERA
jgi:hypothetical protein